MDTPKLIGVICSVFLLGGFNAVCGAELSKEYTSCINSKQTNTDWGICSTEEIDRQEKSLSQIWKEAYEAMKSASLNGAQSLLEEQRAWVKFKDAACSFYWSGGFGREGQELSFGECKAMTIVQRIEGLTELLKELKERSAQ